MRLTACLLLFLALAPASAMAVGGAKADFHEDESDKKAPLKVTSDQMSTDNKKNLMIFTGSVVAVKGKLTVESDKMTVWTNDDQSDFREIKAEGAVRITKGNKVATGKLAHYYADQKKIVLTGDPVLKDGKNTATGKRVIYFFDSEDMVIVGDSHKRSTIEIVPKDKDEDKNAPAHAPGGKEPAR